MSFQAYLDNIKAKTGKTPEDFQKLAAKKKLAKHGEILAWLKADFELGQGHASAMTHLILDAGVFTRPHDERLDVLFSGRKEKWRAAYDGLAAKLEKLGDDVAFVANDTYVNLLRKGKKFGIVQPSSGERLDVGIKLKGASPAGRFEPAGRWNEMVTHRVKISEPKELNGEVVGWLKRAYAAIKG